MARYCLFQPGFRMTDCKEQRKTVKSPDSAWEKAEERRKKNTTGEKAWEARWEKRAEDDVLRHWDWHSVAQDNGAIQTRLRGGRGSEKYQGKRPAGSGGIHANENLPQLIKFQGLVLSYILKCCSQSEAWEKCQTCIRLNSNSQVVCGAKKMRLYVAGESPVKTAGTCRHRCGFIIIYKSIVCVAMQRRGIFSLFNCDTLEGNNSVWMQCWQAAVKWNGST